MASHRAAGPSPGGSPGAAEAARDDRSARPVVPRARDGRHEDDPADPAGTGGSGPSGPRPGGGPAGRLRVARDALRALPRRIRLRWAALSVVLAALPALLVVALSGDPERPGLEADYVSTGTGAQYILHNAGKDTVRGWTLRFRLQPGVELTDVWNGRATDEGDGRWTVREQPWSQALRPGEYVVVGLATSAGTGIAAPSECTINSRPCRAARPGAPQIAPAAPPRTPASQAAPGGPTVAPRTTSPARPGSGAASPAGAPPATRTVPRADGGHARAIPYLDLSVPPAAGDTGAQVPARTLAFVVDGGDCRPMWGGVQRPDDEIVTARVDALRAAGTDIGVAFGGAAGTDLALGCGTPRDLAAAYGQVLDAYGASRVDLYVGGTALARPDVVDRRNRALRILQDERAARALPLEITYSLPVTPMGLGADARDLLAGAVRAGVNVRHVNLLALDYGSAAAPDPERGMGLYATQAAMNTWTQLRRLWPSLTEDQLWGRMQVTVMIGQNDVPAEVFTQDDARHLVAFAADRHLGRIGWWSDQRDRPCPADAAPGASATCSGVPQEAGEFARILGAYG